MTMLHPRRHEICRYPRSGRPHLAQSVGIQPCRWHLTVPMAPPSRHGPSPPSAQSFVHPCRGRASKRRNDTGVDVGRHPDRAVPKRLGDHSELDALGEHYRCGGMPQIVEPQPFDVGSSEERLKAAGDAARRDRTARRSGEDEIIVQPPAPGGEPLLRLCPALIMERGDCEREELDRSPRAVGLRGHQTVDRLALLAKLDGRPPERGTTARVPASRSTSAQRSPSASPRRSPTPRVTATSGASRSPSTAARIARASSGPIGRTRGFGAGGALTRATTLRITCPSRNAAPTAVRSVA